MKSPSYVVVYANIDAKKKPHRLRVGAGLSQILGSLGEQSDSLVAKNFSRPALSRLPGRDSPVNQSFSLGREAKRLGASIPFRHHFQPAVRPHSLDIAAQGRRVELQNLANSRRPRN